MVRPVLKKFRFGMLLSLPRGLGARRLHRGNHVLSWSVYDDGRLDILTAGRAPFPLRRTVTEDPLLQVQV